MVKRFVAGVACALVFAMHSNPAAAQRGGEDQMLELAGTHTVITQRMAKETLLVVLGVDRQRNLRRLQSSRDRFDRVLRGLRQGDESLRIEPASDPGILAELERADSIWTEMDTEILAGLANGDFAPEQVDRIADLSTVLLDTVDTAAAAHADRSAGQHFSMLLVAIDLSDRQRILLEQMTKEFLLVAYGHDVEANRSRLRNTADRFEDALDGLTYGDLDRLLLPPPTESIRDQLELIRQVWRMDLQPAIEAAIAGRQLDSQSIAGVSESSSRLLLESRVAVALYLQL